MCANVIKCLCLKECVGIKGRFLGLKVCILQSKDIFTINRGRQSVVVGQESPGHVSAVIGTVYFAVCNLPFIIFFYFVS